jgi:AAHS family 4-hydroxybenzoate transporter-like MFS transporter
MAFGTLAMAVVWTPLLLRDNGISPAQASIVLGVHGIGALIGMAVAGRLMERLGVAMTLAPSLVLGAVATAMLSHAAMSIATMSTAMFMIGLFVGLGASGSIALAALIYPAAIRSSGVGWAMGMGRFGQVLAPLFAGAVLALGWSNADLFMVIGLAPLIAAAALLALRSSGQKQRSAEVAAAPAST